MKTSLRSNVKRTNQITPGRRPLDLQWNSYLFKKHRLRLKSIKGLVDQSPPIPQSHLNTRQKQEQLKEGTFINLC